MRFTNATNSNVRVVEYDLDADEFITRSEVAPGNSVLLAYVDTAQLEIYENGRQYLVLTKIAGVDETAVQSGGGGVIHDPDGGEPPFGA